MARGNSIPQKMPDRAVQNFTTKKHIHQRPLFYIKEVIENIFGGIIIGSTIFVGGINCGAMANIVSLYDKLIHSIGKLFKNFNYNFLLLLQIVAGIVVGILLFSQIILDLMQKFEYPMMYLFIGAIIGSLPSIYRRGKIKKFNPLYLLWVILGGVLAYTLDFFPKNHFIINPTDYFQSYGTLFISGIVSAIAILIPGISLSHSLYFIGMYNSILSSIISLDLLNLFFIFLGFFIGCLFISKILSFTIKHFLAPTHLIIMGSMLTCVIEIFPGIPNNYIMIACIAGFIFGTGGVYLITK